MKIEGLNTYQSKLESASSVWLKTFRRKSFEQWADSDMPTVKDEEWKYTSLVESLSVPFRLASRHQLIEEKQFLNYRDKADINIVLVNGLLWHEFSDLQHLPYGMKVSSLNQTLTHEQAAISDTMVKLTANDTKNLLWMNQALFLDGVYIEIEKNAVIKPLVHIIHVTSGIENKTVVFPRSFISVGQAAQVNILESHICFEPVEYFANAVVDMRIACDAVVAYCKAEVESHQALHMGSTRIWQEAGSSLDAFSFSYGGKLVRNNLSIFLKGEGANTIMNGLYAIDGSQHVDNHTLLDIQQPHCTSYQLYKGLLNDQARAVFNGKIYVHPMAQKTNAYQLNKHLLLGQEARVDTKPQLEIFADDVKCTHGATIGQLNQEEVFYLQSRCLNYNMAVQLLSKGFIDDIIDTIKVEAIRTKLSRLLLKKFPEVKL